MIENLIRYQEKDAELRKIEVTLSGNEDRKKALTAKKFLETVEDTVNKMEIKSAELVHLYENLSAEIEKINEQKKELDEAVASAEDENALSYVSKKLDELESRVQRLMADASKVNAEMRSVISEYSQLREKNKTAKEQYLQAAGKYNELKESVKSEREQIEKELKGLEKDVPADLMERYKIKRNAKIFPIIYEAKIENKNAMCGACNMELPKSAVSRLESGEVIECDQCGRLIYLKK